jgi:anthranilate phosphoribosyltransferase
MLKEAINILNQKKNLTLEQMRMSMEEIMSGKADDAHIEAFLLGLKAKGETIEEITGAAMTMRKFVKRIKAPAGVVIDTCGTGGDESGTFNVSTIAAFVVAGAGIRVAKHGNRSVSSHCGSADLLEALGVKVVVDAKTAEETLDKIGITFLFAPEFHPAMKYVMPVRKKLKTRTIFNILGPLTNPAFANRQIIGVFNKELVEPLAHVLANLGLVHAMVVHGSDGLDEITTTGPTFVCEYGQNKFGSFSIEPTDFGIPKASAQDLKGADIQANAKIALDILDGKTGAKTDIVLLNAAAAIYLAEKAKNISDGLRIARDTIDSGVALKKLEMLKEFSNAENSK